MLFSQERGRQKIAFSKIELTVHRIQSYFKRKSKTENYLVKNTVKDTQGTILLSTERRKLQIVQSKIAGKGED